MFPFFPFSNISYKCSTNCLLYTITIIVPNFHYLSLQKYATSTFSISNLCICINECENLINSFLIVCFNDFKQRVQKEICFEKPWSIPKFMKQKSDRQLKVIFRSCPYFFSKHFALLIIWWCHIMYPSHSYYKCSFLRLIYYQIWTFLH